MIAGLLLLTMQGCLTDVHAEVRMNPVFPPPALSFGVAVACEGNAVAIGDPAQARVELYELTGSGGFVHTQSITSPASPIGAFFGSSIALSEDWLVIPSIGTYELNFFNLIGGLWQLHQVLTFGDSTTHVAVGFGKLVLEGGQLFMGDPFAPGVSVPSLGRVDVFEPDAFGQWGLVQTIVPPNAIGNSYFGSTTSVSSSGATLAIGADLLDVAGNTTAGGVHIYSQSATGWAYSETIESPEPLTDYKFGSGVAFANERLAVVTVIAEAPVTSRLDLYLPSAQGFTRAEPLMSDPDGLTPQTAFGLRADGDSVLVCGRGTYANGALLYDVGSDRFDEVWMRQFWCCQDFAWDTALSESIAVVGAPEWSLPARSCRRSTASSVERRRRNSRADQVCISAPTARPRDPTCRSRS